MEDDLRVHKEVYSMPPVPAFQGERKPAGLPVCLADLKQMDWLVADAFSIKGSNFLAIGNRSSGIVWAHPLKNMEAKTVKSVLAEYSYAYSGSQAG